MLGLDEQKQLEWRRNALLEKSSEQRRRHLEQEIKNHTSLVTPDCGRDISLLEARMGSPLTYIEFQARLKKCNQNFHFEIANADSTKAGVYLMPEKKFICGMESGIMPEFTVVHKTKTKVANPDKQGDWKEVDTYAGETRGWRTVLARLLHAKLITRSQVEQYFGWNPTMESRNWWNQTDGSDPTIYG